MSKIDEVLDKLARELGERAVVRVGAAPKELFELKVIPTGILDLDLALGVGGFPRGRSVELFGAPGSGKSTIALYAVASAQRMGETAAYIDAEKALDLGLARAYGVDVDQLIYAQPASGEDAVDIAEALLRAGAAVVVVDSVSALIPAAEAAGATEESFIGLHARLMSKAMRKLTVAANADPANRGVVIFINQLRERVGVIYGDPRVTTGGRALPYFASVRIEVASGGKDDRIMRGDEQVGQLVRMYVVKNKTAPPYKKAEFRLIYGVGVDGADQLVRAGLKSGLISQKGAYYTFEVSGEKKTVHGRDALAAYLAEDPVAAAELEAGIRAFIGCRRGGAEAEVVS